VTTQFEVEQPPEPVLSVPAVARDSNTVTISRVLFNYLIIAVSCFAVGLIVGVFAYDRIAQNNRQENTELINNAVAAAVAALPLSPTAQPTPDPNMRYDVSDAGNPSIGPVDAPITIIEFGDFNCHYCKRFFDETLSPLLTAYEGRVRFVFRDYPILGSASVQAALAAECADDQGEFWGFHNLVYQEQNLTRDNFLQYAADLNLDVDTFTTCLDDAVHQQDIETDYLDGAQLGVGGTPTFFINGKILVGAQPYDSFVTLIEAELDSQTSQAESPS
jgi:protein-disulfide isomerase